MKQILVFITMLCYVNLVDAQEADTLRRSAGFYLSPSVTNLYFPESSIITKPGMGLNWGFNFINRWKSGLFIESGIGINFINARYPIKDTSVFSWGRYWHYSEKHIAKQIYLNLPFLVGYKTNKGKIRFQSNIGFSFNIKYSDFENVIKIGEVPYGSPEKELIGEGISFGTSFSGIFKSGICIPLSKRLYLDILPSLRYNFIGATDAYLDLKKSFSTKKQNWSVGIDISLLWGIQNPQRSSTNLTDDKEDQLPDYTFQYAPEQFQIRPQAEEKKQEYKNFLYIEMLGVGLVYSVNYERTVFKKNIFSLQARGGYSILPRSYSFPVGVNVSVGHSGKKFQAGIYSDFENLLFENININIVPELAYRLETKQNFFLRLSVMSHWVIKTGEILPGLGISIGGCF